MLIGKSGISVSHVKTHRREISRQHLPEESLAIGHLNSLLRMINQYTARKRISGPWAAFSMSLQHARNYFRTILLSLLAVHPNREFSFLLLTDSIRIPGRSSLQMSMPCYSLNLH